jgi:transposase-like protein
MRNETRELWSKRVQRWKESGLSAVEYARELGINARTLSYWKWRLKQEPAARTKARPTRTAAKIVKTRPAPVTFVEVPSPTEAPLEVETGPQLELVVGGRYVVRVGARFDENTLGRLLDVVERRA